MRDAEGRLAAFAIIVVALVASSGLVALDVWTWQNAADKRACRRGGGTVVDVGNTEWHCVGAIPEAK